MPFGCSGSDSLLNQTRPVAAVNGTVCTPSSAIEPAASMAASLLSTSSGGTPCGVSPIKPRITALSVAWPTPVSASEPYRAASTPTTSSNGPYSTRKRRAATIGPTVWELDGPMPILKRSNTLMSIRKSLYIGMFYILRLLVRASGSLHRLASIHIGQHVGDHLLDADLCFPAPVRVGFAVVQALRPAVGDGLAAVRLVADLEVRHHVHDGLGQLLRVKRDTCHVVRGADLDLRDRRIHQLDGGADRVWHVDHRQGRGRVQEAVITFTAQGCVENRDGVVGGAAARRRFVADDAWVADA